MATTTFAAFRAEMIIAIQALTPSKPLHDRKPAFKLAKDEVDFREWAPAHPTTCTRVFTIYDLFDDEPIEISDGTADLQPVRVEVLMAYQHDFKYGANNIRARQDVIREDYRDFEKALGINGTANYTNGCTIKEDGPPFDVEPLRNAGVSILVIPYLVRFLRAI